MHPRTTAIAIAITLGLGLTACGDDTDTTAGEPIPAAIPTASTAAPAPAGEKPKVEVPEGKPSKELEVRDIKAGSGPAAKAGDQLLVHYVGVSHSTGKQFDASWDGGQPFPFELGAGSVIGGWDEGLQGMKAGGRRELIIPPDLAYGDTGSGDIKPGETLIFVVDLLQIG